METVIKVLIVDDHPMVRKGLAMFVGGFEDLRLVGEAADAASALEAYQREQPDVVLMDMVMPGENGAAVIYKIRQKFPDAAIIALTSFEEEDLIKNALLAGARGFLYKDVSVDELVDAIRQVHRGCTILDSKASAVMLRLVSAKLEPASEVPRADLSEREMEVLKYLVEGLTNKQIASYLGIQPSTVKQYISNILSKLDAQSRTEATAIALRLGLIEL